MQIQISWLLQKPIDLDLHCLQGRVYPGLAGQGLRILYNNKFIIVTSVLETNAVVTRVHCSGLGDVYITSKKYK